MVADKSKVGIVGRTGAGKSSIIQALFRAIEPGPGTIYKIGKENALEMGLHVLRKSLSVIPQSPFLFRGTIARNIDPFNAKTEREIWSALETAGLKKYVMNVIII